MPELPEVEHTRAKLAAWGIEGATLSRVTTSDALIVEPTSPRAFVRRLTGRKIERLERKGKWMRLLLDDEQRLFVHLGMTGWFEKGDADEIRFERVRFEITKGRKRSAIVYTDSRRWGRMVLSREDIRAWTLLGPDPLADGIDVGRLVTKLARRKKVSIKEALMDQSVLAGVGNIQAIEALWKAEIDPRSRAAAVDERAMKAIARGLRWTIERTLADLEKSGMDGVSPFRVYGRKGEPCPRCGVALERFELGGRTTTMCSGCQRRLG
jgi:formamidopyrimidine-DNA glycosylase